MCARRGGSCGYAAPIRLIDHSVAEDTPATLRALVFQAGIQSAGSIGYARFTRAASTVRQRWRYSIIPLRSVNLSNGTDNVNSTR